MKLDHSFYTLLGIQLAQIHKLIKSDVSLPDDHKWQFLQTFHDYILWATIF